MVSKAKALAKKRKPASEDVDYKAMVDQDRMDDATDEERAELAAAKAVNESRDSANSMFQSGAKMQNDEYNRSVKAEAMARAKKARAKNK